MAAVWSFIVFFQLIALQEFSQARRPTREPLIWELLRSRFSNRPKPDPIRIEINLISPALLQSVRDKIGNSLAVRLFGDPSSLCSTVCDFAPLTAAAISQAMCVVSLPLLTYPPLAATPIPGSVCPVSSPLLKA